ncbi:MAG: class I SAM-dependent methyltransferase, partial [Phycisphaerales bacterium]|nr:class I SAM-dependent methyltransferase [Phycisphaerales bacterium]
MGYAAGVYMTLLDSTSRAVNRSDANPQPVPRSCWCGTTDKKLDDFSEDYVRCPGCDTLVSIRAAEGEITRVTDEISDLYGRSYWFEHQAGDLGHPTIEQRARTDLHERVLHWLKALLKYRRPPGRFLEIGCAHGGFVHFAGVAGFDARGLELSPTIAELAERTFHVPVLHGPIEDQPIAPGSLDVVAAMDVLEHLASPVATLTHCAKVLTPRGLLFIQTPRYPAPATSTELRASSHRFIEHMRVPEEHLYLFSERGLQEVLALAGFEHIVTEPAIFDHYDQFVVASRAPIAPCDDDPAELPAFQGAAGLERGGRFQVAFQDHKARTSAKRRPH